MRPISIVLLICFSFQCLFLPCSSILAQTREKPGFTLGIVPLKAAGISTAEASVFSSRLNTELVGLNIFKIVEIENIPGIYDELKLQRTGYFRNDAAVKIGQQYGARGLVFGSVGRIDNTYTIDIRTIDLETREICFSVQRNKENKTELLNSMKSIAIELALKSNDKLPLDANTKFKISQLRDSYRYSQETSKKKGSKKTLYFLGAAVVGGVVYFVANSGKNGKSTKGSVMITIPGDI